MNTYLIGGEVRGPKLNGKILPVGGDWFTLRTDGVGIIDVRATIETKDGVIIYTYYTGVADCGEDAYDKFLQGETPPKIKVRVAPRFQTAHPEYKWLNRLQCVGIGEADLERSEVSYDFYALM